MNSKHSVQSESVTTTAITTKANTGTNTNAPPLSESQPVPLSSPKQNVPTPQPLPSHDSARVLQKPSTGSLNETVPKKPSLLIEASLKPVPFVAPQLVFETQRSTSASVSEPKSIPVNNKKRDASWKRKTIYFSSTQYTTKEREDKKPSKEKKAKEKKEKSKQKT
jgi:hypothetical protein